MTSRATVLVLGALEVASKETSSDKKQVTLSLVTVVHDFRTSVNSEMVTVQHGYTVQVRPVPLEQGWSRAISG